MIWEEEWIPPWAQDDWQPDEPQWQQGIAWPFDAIDWVRDEDNAAGWPISEAGPEYWLNRNGKD